MRPSRIPLISVVTADYNGAAYIEENILSVKNQGYPAIEHIIVDGGSTDGTVDIIKRYAGSYNLKWVSEKDGGIYYAFNKGFAMATGDVYAWLDGDNYFKQGIVQKVADIFQKENCDVVYGDIEFVSAGDAAARRTVDGDAVKLYQAPAVSFRNALIKNTGAIPLQPAAFLKKELYRATGDFDTNYRIAADYDFWMRVLRRNPKLCYLPLALGVYRKGDAAASQSVAGISRGFKEMLAIGDVYGQPWYGKLFLTAKYFLAFVKALL